MSETEALNPDNNPNPSQDHLEDLLSQSARLDDYKEYTLPPDLK